MAFIKPDYLIRGRVDLDRCNKCPYVFKRVAGHIDSADFRQHKTSHLLEPTTSFLDVYPEEHVNTSAPNTITTNTVS